MNMNKWDEYRCPHNMYRNTIHSITPLINKGPTCKGGTHLDCEQHTDEKVELIELDSARIINIEHIKHLVYLELE